MIRTAIEKSLRLVQLGLAVTGAAVAELLKRKAKDLEIRLDGLTTGLAIVPPADIPTAQIAVDDPNPVMAMEQSPEFLKTVSFFENNPAAKRSLVSPRAQALLFTLIRN